MGFNLCGEVAGGSRPARAVEYHVVLGIEFPEWAHAQPCGICHSTDLDRLTYLAAITPRSAAIGRIVGRPDGAVADGAGRALANRCAGGYLSGRFYPVGGQHGSAALPNRKECNQIVLYPCVGLTAKSEKLDADQLFMNGSVLIFADAVNNCQM